MTAEKVSLGEKLYFDNRSLSTERSVAAPATTPRRRSPDNNMAGIGIGLKKRSRNAPTVLNSMFNERSVYNARRKVMPMEFGKH